MFIRKSNYLPEKPLSSKYESPEIASERMDNVEAILEKYGSKNRIDERDYKDMYPDAESDYKRSKEKEKHFEEESKKEGEEHMMTEKVAKALESVIANIGNDYSWFGANTELRQTALKDDIEAGVDLLMISKDEHSEEQKTHYIGLAIDAVMTSSYGKVKEKFNENLREILRDRDKGAEVKYGVDGDGNKTRIKNIPRVVLALDGRHTDLLFRSIVEYIDSETRNKKYPGEGSAKDYHRSIKKLMESPAAQVFLQEIKLQLDFYSEKLSDQKTQEALDMKANIESANNLIKSIQKEREEHINEIRYDWFDDRGMGQIARLTGNFGTPSMNENYEKVSSF